MEIDLVETAPKQILDVPPEEEDEEEQQYPKIPAPSDGLVATLSNSLILSPTSFGARMALRLKRAQPKHIPEPEHKSQPEPEQEQEYDYEVDTSNYAHTLRQRNVSSYSSAPLNDLLVREDSEKETEPTWMLLHLLHLRDNLMSQSYSLRKQMDLINNRVIEVHHHYYGAGPSTGPGSSSGLASDIAGLAVASRAGPGTSAGPISTVASPVDQNFQPVALAPRPPFPPVGAAPGASLAPVLPFPWRIHPLPYLITTYLQLVANAGALLFGVHLLWKFVQVIKSDIAHKLTMHSSSILVDIDTCRRQYIDNNCFPDEIVPALEKQCSIWLKCMKQDPYGGGNKSLVSAETIGMILNSLIEPLGLKFWLVITGLVAVMLLSNFSFGYLRAKTYYGWHRP